MTTPRPNKSRSFSCETGLTTHDGLYMDLLALLDDRKAEFPVMHAAKLASSRRCHSVSQRPPDSLKMIMSLIRKIPKLEKFSSSNIIRKLNYCIGYDKAVDNELVRDSKAYFAEARSSSLG